MSKITIAKGTLIVLILAAILVSGVLSAEVSLITVNSQNPSDKPNPSGSKGDAGAAGSTGASGATGSQGPKGDTGVIGAAGPAGPQGPKGDSGATELQGGTGATGATGPQGPPGTSTVKYDYTSPTSDPVALKTDPKNFAMVTLTAPTNGYVLITVTATAETFGDGTQVELGIGTSTNSFDIYRSYAGVSSTSGGSLVVYTYWPMTVQAVVPVTSGNGYAFFANAELSANIHNDPYGFLSCVYMTAVFYPT